MKNAVSSLIVVLAVVIVSVVVILSIILVTNNMDNQSIRDVTAVDNLVYSCFESSLIDGLILLGKNGGWLDYSVFEVNQESPTEGNVLPVSDTEYVPYWFYMSDNNLCDQDCSFSTMSRNLSDIERDLQIYVSEKTKKCFSDNYDSEDHSSIYYNYDVQLNDEPVVDIIFKNKEVIADLFFPITITEKGTENIKIREQYSVNVDVPFKEMYELSQKIVLYNEYSRKLDAIFLQLVSLYSGLNENLLPPPYELTVLDVSPVIWDIKSIKDKISYSLLPSYLNQLEINNSKNQDVINLPEIEKEAFEDLLLWDLKDSRISNYVVDLTYNPKWKPFISFDPYQGYIYPMDVEADNNFFTGMLGLTGIKKYDVNYDVSYPVLVELKDEKAMSNQGYTFRFALEANIRNTEIMTSEGVYSTADVPSTLCDKDLWSEETYSIKVVDQNNNPVNDVSLTLSAFSDSCFLGKTDNNGKLETALPEGIFTIDGEKQGYVILSHLVEVPFDLVDENYKLIAYPEKEIIFKVGKETITDDKLDEKNFDNSLGSFDIDEIGTIIMTNKDNQKYVYSFNINSMQIDEKIALVPGNYSIYAIVIYNNTVTIPEECLFPKMLSADSPLCSQKTEALTVDNYPVSILIFDEQTELVEITPEKLYSSNSIELSLPVLPKPTDFESLNRLNELNRWIESNPEEFMPVFI